MAESSTMQTDEQRNITVRLANNAANWAIYHGFPQEWLQRKPFVSSLDFLMIIFSSPKNPDLAIVKKNYMWILQYLHPEVSLANLWVGKEYEEIAKLYKREAGARKRTRDEMEEDTLDSLMEDLAAEVLSCPVCFEPIGTMVTLSCGHSLCLDCTQKIIGCPIAELQDRRVQCSECRRYTRVVPHYRMTAFCERYWQLKAEGKNRNPQMARRAAGVSNEDLVNVQTSLNAALRDLDHKLVKSIDERIEMLQLSLMEALGDMQLVAAREPQAPAPASLFVPQVAPRILAWLRGLIG